MSRAAPAAQLTPADLRALGRFLASNPQGPDVAWLDGYLHGVAALPEPLPPAEWLQAVTPPAATVTAAHARRYYALVSRHQAAVAAQLQAGQPQPLSDGTPEDAARWLAGFARGLTRQPGAIQRLQGMPDAAQLALLVLAHAEVGAAPGSPAAQALLNRTREYTADTLERSDPQQNRAFLAALAVLACGLLRRP